VAAERAAEPSATTDLTIISPMVGTFYRAPSPDSKPYVDVGSVVEKEDVVCIIEAMKMMNEIRAEMRGRVRKILAENGQPIEYDQPLFLLEPL
jgi:acetyl-CoA carboxylase biotin carboxyl carrier protein